MLNLSADSSFEEFLRCMLLKKRLRESSVLIYKTVKIIGLIGNFVELPERELSDRGRAFRVRLQYLSISRLRPNALADFHSPSHEYSSFKG